MRAPPGDIVRAEVSLFSCPECQRSLRHLPAPGGALWECPSCHGRVADFAALRQTPAGSFARRLWTLAVHTPNGRRVCPGCGKGMAEVPALFAPGAPGPLRLDVCPRCELIWFDPGEHEAWLRAPSSAAATENLPPDTQHALEVAGVHPPPQVVAEGSKLHVPGDDVGWKQLICLLGLPVEVDAEPLRSTPWTTWSLASLILTASFFGLGHPKATFAALGLVPASLWRLHGLTLVTSFFLHANLWHLLGNLYYLVVFGDDVEDRLGFARYLGLIALSSLTGDLLHAAINPNSTIPTIGASGGIAGVLAFYALRFPRRHLRLFYFFRFRDVRVSTAMTLWLVLQVVGAGTQVASGVAGGVAYLVHLGGALVGVFFWARDRESVRVIRGTLAGES